jgi:hypothetical protein
MGTYNFTNLSHGSLKICTLCWCRFQVHIQLKKITPREEIVFRVFISPDENLLKSETMRRIVYISHFHTSFQLNWDFWGLLYFSIYLFSF